MIDQDDKQLPLFQIDSDDFVQEKPNEVMVHDQVVLHENEICKEKGMFTIF